MGQVGERAAYHGLVPDAHQSRAVPGTVEAHAGWRPGSGVQARQTSALPAAVGRR